MPSIRPFSYTGGQQLIDKRRQRQPRTRVNWMIRVPEVRVIDNEGEQLGVMPTEKALALAEEKALDLVEVSPTARPPVCRIVDYGKFKYEASKRLRESKKKQHTVQVKEIKLRPKIGEHDFQFKKRHAVEFLESSDKVKFTVIFRGRELDHKELGANLLQRMIKELQDIGVVERPAQFEGRLMTMYMGPVAGALKKRKPQRAKAAKPKASPAATESTTTKAEAKPAATESATTRAEAKPAATESTTTRAKAKPAAKQKEDQDAKNEVK
ncbi:MAG: translation initiation factor IF-3 [bacterium]|nr:translation initiation factor IF-3 [bacterium]